MKSLLVILLSSALLVGCSLFQTKGTTVPKFDSYAMSLCVETLEDMPQDVKSWDTIFEYKIKDTKAYAECKNKHKALVESVKKYTEEFK